MLKKLANSARFYRVAESLIPLSSWLMITFPIWFSLFHPAVVGYFILAFFLYFLYKSIKNVYYAGLSYKLIDRAEKINWYSRLIKNTKYEQIEHYVVICNYKESVKKLEETIDRIVDQKYLLKKIHIVLAMEEREGEDAKNRGEILKQKYEKKFASFESIFHVMAFGEVVGKASNESYSVSRIYKKIEAQGIDPKKVLITICDADSLLPNQYFSYTTYEFLKDKDRDFHFYWAPVLLYNNFWELPLPVRLQSILSSVLRLAFLSQRDDLIQISTYTTNLWLLNSVGYWDVDIIPEDWHIWLQAFFKFGEKVKTIPIYSPITCDATLSPGLWNTFKSRYEQEMRWAWGVSDIPYSIKRSLETPDIPWSLKLKKIMNLAETHLLWPTSFFILTISASIPPLINPAFGRTVMGELLPRVSSFILTISSLLLIFILYFDYKMRDKIKVKTSLINLPLLFVQWFFLPVISFFLSSLPALEAHTRMLLGKKIEYKVTEKI
jgi:hypothetical protein